MKIELAIIAALLVPQFAESVGRHWREIANRLARLAMHREHLRKQS